MKTRFRSTANAQASLLLLSWAILLSNAVCLSTALANDWTGFRGPGSRGISDEVGLPDRWDTKENVAWQVAIPGRGWSSPIIQGKRVFLTSAVGGDETTVPRKGLYGGGERKDPPTTPLRWMVYCLDFDTGAMNWALDTAMAWYAQPDLWQRLVQNAMRCDFSWETQANEYLKLFAGLLQLDAAALIERNAPQKAAG